MIKNIRKIVKEGYEKIDYADRFRKSSQPSTMKKKFMDLLAAHIPKTAKILDFGCGIGIPFDKYLAEKGFQVTGIDFTSKHIALAKKNVPDATFIEGDFSKTDFDGKHFHAIIALYSIYHIPREEQQNLFHTMHDLLEKRGVILMTLGTSNTDGLEEDWIGVSMAWSNYDPALYAAMINKAGFEIMESEYEGRAGDGEYHWWVLAKKK